MPWQMSFPVVVSVCLHQSESYSGTRMLCGSVGATAFVMHGTCLLRSAPGLPCAGRQSGRDEKDRFKEEREAVDADHAVEAVERQHLAEEAPLHAE